MHLVISSLWGELTSYCLSFNLRLTIYLLLVLISFTNLAGLKFLK